MSKEIQQMFASIARRYDRANDVLSFGIHRLWRKQALSFANVGPGDCVLDLCCGTGDFSFAAAKVVGASGRVIGLDFVINMLSLAQRKQARAATLKSSSLIPFIHGDAMNLPFSKGSFSAVTIGFGIRNVDDPFLCVAGIRQVLKPGGKIIVLEFGQPTLPGWSTIYRLYSKYVLPLIGSLLTGNRQAYEYLPESSQAFPAGERFLDLLRQAEYRNPQFRSLFGGIAFIYTAKA